MDCPWPWTWPWTLHGHGHGHGQSMAMDMAIDMAMDSPWPWTWPWTVHGHGPSMAMARPGPAGPAQKARRLLYKNTTPFTIQEYRAVYYTRIPRRLLSKNTTPFTIQANHANTIQASRANILGASRRLLTEIPPLNKNNTPARNPPEIWPESLK